MRGGGDFEWLKSKLTDLEDRSRLNNVQIRGIPESVKNHDLRPFFTNILNEALPDLPLEEIAIDRIHRFPKPKPLTDWL